MDLLKSKRFAYTKKNKNLPGRGDYMSRNVTIVVIILIVVLLAGYLVWLRGRYSPLDQGGLNTVEVTPTPTPTPQATPTASASATPTATASATVSPRATSSPATGSGSQE